MMNAKISKAAAIRIFVLGASISLGGCAIGWTKPGVTQSEFNQDRYDCQKESAQTYPVAIVQRAIGTGYQTSAQTQCNNSGYGNINCTTTGGGYIPPSTVTEDANLNNRNMAFQSCMQALGYEFKMEFKNESQSSSVSTPAPDSSKKGLAIAGKIQKQKNSAGDFAMYKRSADAGDPDAKMKVAGMYFSGEGVQKDYAQSFAIYKELAEAGRKDAQKKTAIMYELGFGVERNQHEADVWYKRSGQTN